MMIVRMRCLEEIERATHNGVLDLGVHQESSVFVGDESPVLVGEDVRQTVPRPPAILPGSQVGHQNLPNPIYYWTSSSRLALDNSF